MCLLKKNQAFLQAQTHLPNQKNEAIVFSDELNELTFIEFW
jgi:hypothetical protein